LRGCSLNHFEESVLLYSEIADTYEKIEATTKRLEMTDLLVDLLERTSKEIIDKVVYLTQGKIYPDFVKLEIGVAERLAIKALAHASGRRESEIEEDVKKTGDIGETAQKFIAQKRQLTFFQKPLTVRGFMKPSTRWLGLPGRGLLTLRLRFWLGFWQMLRLKRPNT
jgi:DNA ligase-1